jgi:hypothetical protein
MSIDTADWQECSRCDDPIAPHESKLVVGMIVEGVSWIEIFCPFCAPKVKAEMTEE